MAHLAFDVGDVEVFACAAPYLSCHHLQALASALEGDLGGIHLLQRAGNDDCPAVGACRHLEQAVAFADGIEKISCLGVAEVEVSTESFLAGEDVGAAGTKALHGYAEGDEAPLQGIFLDLLQQCHRHVDVVHCQYSWSHCSIEFRKLRKKRNIRKTFHGFRVFRCSFFVFIYAAKLRKPNLALSGFVGFCQFLSVFGTMLFHDAKIRKGNLALTFCLYLSPFSKMLFHDAKLRKEKLALSAFVRICPEMSAFVRFRHSNVSYCRCKVTKKYFGIVTLVSPYA